MYNVCAETEKALSSFANRARASTPFHQSIGRDSVSEMLFGPLEH